jgi:hypothetical protein
MSLYAWRKIFMNGKTVRPLFLQPFLIFHAVPCIREKEKNMKEYKPFKSGKVRELYDLGDSLVMVCTDRISAFDVILKDPVPERRHPEQNVQILVRFHQRHRTKPYDFH